MTSTAARSPIVAPGRDPLQRLLWLLALMMSLTPAAGQTPAPAWRLTRISYLTSATVYLDAGLDDGIDMNQELEVVRGDEVIAVLRVTYLSSHRAACARLSGTAPLAVGDSVRYVPRATALPVGPAVPVGPTTDETIPAPRPARSGIGLHGRVGVRYLAVRSKDPEGSEFSQPGVDLRLDGTQVGGAPLDLSVDVRSRTTRQTVSDVSETENLSSIYRMAVSWHQPGSPWRVTAGRTFSPSLASVDLFDGVEVRYDPGRWNAGLFAGTEPEDGTLGYSSDVHEYGGYVGFRSEALAERRWSVTTGWIGSYEESEINREFAYIQGAYNDRRLSVWLAEETDLNRGWKKEAEGTSWSLTSVYLNLRFLVNEAWTLRGGYDNRRNVLLYRDLVTPVTEFDDEYRQGGWAGATCRFLEHFTVGMDLRFSAGGDAGSADGYTLTMGADRLTRLMMQIQARSTRYTNDRVEGWLHSFVVGTSLGSRWYVEAQGGVRDETNLTSSLLDETLTWYGLGLDVNLGRHWFASVDVETSNGGSDAVDQLYSSVTYRF